MGFTADVIIWDLETRQLLHRLSLHKVWALSTSNPNFLAHRPVALKHTLCTSQVRIQALDFSHDEQYLVSLGGPDDNALVSLDLDKYVFEPLRVSIISIGASRMKDILKCMPCAPCRYYGRSSQEGQSAVAPRTTISR